MAHSGVVVFTGKSTGTLLAEGGSSCWVVDTARVRRCDYVICTWNTTSEMGEDEGVPRGTAFLIGEISGTRPCRRAPKPGRAHLKGHVIEFSRYARLNIPNVWPGQRQPVMYVDDVEQLLGLKLAELKWRST
jgi:hypothetical protein